MRTLVWIYIALYALLSIMVVSETALEEEERDPLWDRVVSSILLVLGFAGMLLYQRPVEIAGLQSVWKVVVPILAVGYVLLSLKDARELLREDGGDPQERAAGIWIGGTLAAFLLVPSLWLNYLYAYG